MFSFLRVPFSLPNFQLPSLSLPASIQSRFISFVLQKSLGHLVKPGQLDSNKVNAQLGSGLVQIHDVELDQQSINQHLQGLPIQLQDGLIGSVAVSVPIQNILTAPLSLEIDRLELSFTLQKLESSPSSLSEQLQQPTEQLAQSVVSVAQEFIHDELDAQSLRESLILEENEPKNRVIDDDQDDMATHVPGSLDPFVDDAFEANLRGVINKEKDLLDDVEGVSVLAHLIERVLARLAFTASNILIRIIHPDTSEIEIVLKRIQYRTEEQSSPEGVPESPSTTAQGTPGAKRTVEVQGFQVFLRDLSRIQDSESSPVTLRTVISRSQSVASIAQPPIEDNNDSDEELDASMTESVLSLPPPPSNTLDSSMTSTIYHSMPSVRAHTPPPLLHPDSEGTVNVETGSSTEANNGSGGMAAGVRREEPSVQSQSPPNSPPVAAQESHVPERPLCILSFGKEPIRIILTTPLPHNLPSRSTTPSAGNQLHNLQAEIQFGSIVCALRTDQIGILAAMVAFASPATPRDGAAPASATSQRQTKKTSPPNPILASLQVEGGIQSITLYLFDSSALDEVLFKIFEHPKSTALHAPHINVHFEGIVVVRPPNGPIRGRIKDFSAFYIYQSGAYSSKQETSASADATQGPNVWRAPPILIVDHYLSSQYTPSSTTHSSEHVSIPVIDWTTINLQSSTRPKPSLWRTKPSAGTNLKQSRTKPIIDDPSLLEAVSLDFDPISGIAGVEVAPLHLFIDTAFIGWVVSFSQELTDSLKILSSEPEKQIDEYSSQPARRGWMSVDEQANRTIERGHRESHMITPRAKRTALPLEEEDPTSLPDRFIADLDRKRTKQEPIRLQVKCVMIRSEIRYTSSSILQGRTKQRSGALVMDIHAPSLIQYQPIANSVIEHDRKARFDEAPAEARSVPLVMSLEWNHVLAFYATPVETKASRFLSLSPMEIEQENALEMEVEEPLLPGVRVRSGPITTRDTERRDTYPTTTTSLEVMLPSLLITINKVVLDGLQIWADDLAQWAERLAQGKGSPSGGSLNSSRTDSRAQSMMIGSRYFAERTASKAGEEEPGPSEFVVKVNLNDAHIQLLVPRQDGSTRPLDLTSTDIEVILEMKPEGRDETIVIVQLADLSLQDVFPDRSVTIFSPTYRRRLLGPGMPNVKLRLDSISLPDTKAKQSKINATISRFTFHLYPDFTLFLDLGRFASAPPGVFEQVVPTERTILDLTVKDGSICLIPPNHPGSLVALLEEINIGTEIVNGSPDMRVTLMAESFRALLIDDRNAPPPESLQNKEVSCGLDHWVKGGHALILHASSLQVQAKRAGTKDPPVSRLDVSRAIIAVHLCADTIPALATLGGDFATLFQTPETTPPKRSVTPIQIESKRDLSMTIYEDAFKVPPDIGPEPDMVKDDLPSNTDFIDGAYGSDAGVRPITEEDVEEDIFDKPYSEGGPREGASGFVSTVRGETIRLLSKEGIRVVEGYFDRLPPETMDSSSSRDEALNSVHIRDTMFYLHLHSGYDWHRTRKTIEDEAKAIRRRLEKIKQLLATGQTPDDSIEKTNAVLFNSVYLGLDADIEDLDEKQLEAAIDANFEDEYETASQESWQSLPVQSKQQRPEVKPRRKKLRTRSKMSEVEIQLLGLNGDVEQYPENAPMASRVFATVRDLKILDHMKTSTWDHFLTSMRTDSRGNTRETDSNMVRLELQMVRPSSSVRAEEARLKAKILPIKLHVDQDALDFLKRFFSFQDVNGFVPPVPPTPSPETYFQRAEIFPVELKLDYKPKRVDYKAIKEGRTIEFMNFFHFEDAEMTLRHLTLTGVTGWARLGDMLNDLWTPDVKANQLADVISGVAPIRSLVNVGTGVADLVLLPISQYKKDKRLVRGVQKGTAAFMKTTAMETIKLGAKLATGTQIILEHAEHVLGADMTRDGQRPFSKTITAEAMPSPVMKPSSALGSEHEDGGGSSGEVFAEDDFEDGTPVYSRYAAQPEDVREGIHTAYKSLSKNLNAAAQTILAVPMEMYERPDSGGPMRAVVRAVPIAVIKPMIGASEAVSKTLLGLRNTLDPDIIGQNEDKYKGTS